jgi:4-amino-4-deoxy-L-arabinose transferase-like glycosyltransferase
MQTRNLEELLRRLDDNPLRPANISQRKPQTRPSHSLVAVGLAVLAVALLVGTARDIGLTWDEPAYIVASESYLTWFAKLVTQPGYALSDQGIQTYWGVSHEHPPFDKVWSGLMWLVSKASLDDLTAHRLGNMLLAGLLVGLVYYLVAIEYGYAAGLIAAAALLTMPRFFFHAHLAAIDVPVAVMIFATGLVFVRTVDRPEFKWTLLLGLVWGLALATKINALFVPPITLTLWVIVTQSRRTFLLSRLLVVALVGVVIYLLIWPWLYHDTVARLLADLNFMTVGHYKITQYYHGYLFAPPKWHFPFVMTVLVVPLSLTILYGLGSIRALLRPKAHPLAWYCIFGALVPLGILASGKTQVFDNERLSIATFPYLAALAGIGFAWLLRRLQCADRFRRKPALVKTLALVLGCLILLPQTVAAAQLYPHLLSYYSELVGGLPGATRLGMETTYWGETYQDALPYLNAYAPQGALIWVEAYDIMLYYQRHGQLRPDLRIAGGEAPLPVYSDMKVSDSGIESADFSVVEYRQSGFDRAMRDWLNGRTPEYEIDAQGVRLMGVFKH